MNKSILFVDDEEMIRTSLTRQFKEWLASQGVDMLTAESGMEALSILKENNDVVVLVSDLRMPGMLGSELLQRVADSYPEIVLILLSGYSELEHLGQSIKAGITAFIQKPWDRTSFKAELNRALLLQGIRKQNAEYHKYLEEEIIWSKRIQKLLLEDNLETDIRPIRSIRHIPLEKSSIGGDVFWSKKISETQFMVAIGDVEARGIKGSYFALQLQKIEQSIAAVQPRLLKEPQNYLLEINNRLIDAGIELPDLMVTLQALYFDMEKKELSFSNAGHIPFLLLREDKAEQGKLDSPGLGYQADIHFPLSSIDLQSGDRVLLLSDGAMKEDASHRHGSPMDLTRYIPATKGEHWVNVWLENIRAELKQSRFWDDVTVIEIQV